MTTLVQLHRTAEIHNILVLFVGHDVGSVQTTHETATPGSVAVTMTKGSE